MINNKISPSTNTTASGTTNNSKITIHAMPPKFLPLRKKARNYDFLFFIFIFLIVAGGGIFIFKDYIFTSRFNHWLGSKVSFFSKQQSRVADVKDDSSGLSHSPSKDNLLPSTASSTKASAKNDGNSATSTDSRVPSPTGNLDNINIAVIPPALDQDNDFLTNEEESLFGTNYLLPDTDQDGFLDGQEVANLYNPLMGQSSLLKNTNFVETYKDSHYNYSILYPSSWRVIPIPNSTRDITFVSPQKEFIEVTIMDNPEGLSAPEWYLKQIPKNLLYKAERVWVNNFLGIKSVDGMTVYLTPISSNKNFIYSISYMVGDHTHITYPTVFQMMVRSFDVSY